MSTITMRVGDSAPNFPITCTRNGAVVDLTGATVKLIISNSGGTRTNNGHSTCTITSATAGTANYDVLAADFPVADTYTADTEITYGNGDVETTPQSQIIVVLAKN